MNNNKNKYLQFQNLEQFYNNKEQINNNKEQFFYDNKDNHKTLIQEKMDIIGEAFSELISYTETEENYESLMKAIHEHNKHLNIKLLSQYKSIITNFKQ